MRIGRIDNKQYNCLIFDLISMSEEVARRIGMKRSINKGRALLEFQNLLSATWGKYLLTRRQRPVSRSWIEIMTPDSELVFVSAKKKRINKSMGKLSSLILEAVRRLGCTIVTANNLNRITALGWTCKRASEAGASSLLVSDHSAAPILLSDGHETVHVLQMSRGSMRLITPGSFLRDNGYSRSLFPLVLALSGVNEEGINKWMSPSAAEDLAKKNVTCFGSVVTDKDVPMESMNILLAHTKPIRIEDVPEITRPRQRTSTSYLSWLIKMDAYDALSAAQRWALIQMTGSVDIPGKSK